MNIVEARETDIERRLRRGRAGIVPSVFVALGFFAWSADEALSATITIAGNGPELRMVERLTRTFEKQHLGTVAEIRWDPSFQPTHMVKSGEADFAVTGQTDPDLVATPIAWDGIAVVVDFAMARSILSLRAQRGPSERWSDRVCPGKPVDAAKASRVSVWWRVCERYGPAKLDLQPVHR